MRGQNRQSLVASPVLVGAVTVLTALIAVFLAYNANAGLPFVPTYDLKAEIPGGSNLVKGNEVRMGGFRVGVVERILPGVAEPGELARGPAGRAAGDLGDRPSSSTSGWSRWRRTCGSRSVRARRSG